MYLKIALELLVAFFAVLGFYGTIHWIVGKLFGSRRIWLAIEILTQRDAESAEALIRDALFRYLSLPSGGVIVLTIPEIAEHPILNEALDTYGLSCYVLGDWDEGTKQKQR